MIGHNFCMALMSHRIIATERGTKSFDLNEPNRLPPFSELNGGLNDCYRGVPQIL